MNCCERHAAELPGGCYQGRECPERAHRAAMNAPLRTDGGKTVKNGDDDPQTETNPLPDVHGVMRLLVIWVCCFITLGLCAFALWPAVHSNWARMVALFAFT